MAELRELYSPEAIAKESVTTLAELPGHTIVGVHGIVAHIGTDSGKTAQSKANSSFEDALLGVRRAAHVKGANAIVGLQIANFGASRGGALGDAVGTTLMGTAVTVRPVD
jgi:uncharacterized protein YbjQ (UPF0145 family)